MATRLKDLVVKEISLVDIPANPGARILLAKRAGDVSKQADGGPEGEMAMTDAAGEIQKKLDDATAALAKANSALEKSNSELAFLKMPEAHRAYMDEAGMNDAAKAVFIAKSEAGREAFIKANPVEMKLPASVVKALELARQDREALEKLREKDEIATFAKRAGELGCAAEFGEVLRKARSGNGEAFIKIEEQLKALNAQVKTGKLFAEFGSTAAHSGSAYDTLNAKAEELRKVQPSLTREQAFTKVYGDRANRDLVAEYKREMNRAS